MRAATCRPVKAFSIESYRVRIDAVDLECCGNRSQISIRIENELKGAFNPWTITSCIPGGLCEVAESPPDISAHASTMLGTRKRRGKAIWLCPLFVSISYGRRPTFRVTWPTGSHDPKLPFVAPIQFSD